MLCAMGIAAVVPGDLSAQNGPSATEEVAVASPDDVRDAARRAQSTFERRRIRYLPLGPPVGSSMCDGTVGRFCWWAEDDGWYPEPEDERIVAMRSELRAELDSLQSLAPGDDWILGQRVWYHAQAGAYEEALAAARACAPSTPWWCRALEGFALHRAGRYVAAEAAFDEAITVMDPETASRWTVPRWTVDGDIRSVVRDLESDPLARSDVLESLWWFSDPLYLVPGNDRRSSHLSRWVVAELRKDARNPFRIAWGEDLTQLTVRNGWEIGWERSTGFGFNSVDEAIGRKHPEARDFMAAEKTLRWPPEAEPRDFVATRSHSRTLYAPAYAPVLLPMDGAISVFPRGETMVFVATQSLPEDTTYHAKHANPRPWMEPADQAGAPDVRGLFALPVAELAARDGWVGVRGDGLRATRATGSADGALLLEVPTGDYLISSESLSPSGRRAGRFRAIVRSRLAPPDLATVSDILLLRPDVALPDFLEEAVDRLAPTPTVQPGAPIALGWEVAGLGFRAESLGFEVSIARTDRSVWNRIGGALGLSDGPHPTLLSWEEPGPSEPGTAFFSVRLDLPDLEPGRYRARVRLHTVGRTPAERTVDFVIEASR
ncbi:MAG: hypothetical protein AAF389_09900 [Gemmatimonadota bacterium]